MHHLKKAQTRGAARYFVGHVWPAQIGRCALYIQGVILFRTDDVNDAFGWREAANAFSLNCDLFIEG
jgi:hypothetical protein